MSELLLEGKASIIAAFASGPAIMIEDDRLRDSRLAGLLAVYEMECESTSSSITQLRPKSAVTQSLLARVVPLRGDELHASNTRINWPALIDEIRDNPGVSKTLVYDDHHVAVVTVSRQRQKYPDVHFMSERRGDGGAVVITYR